MSKLDLAALLLAAIGPLLALARWLKLPESLLLFAAGVGVAFVPGLPEVEVDAQLMLALFLPPILYASTVRVSWHLLRHTLGAGLLVGVALSLAGIAAVAALARVLFPGIEPSAAVLLGVVAALFDTRLFHEAKGRPHVPRAIADTLKAREMAGRVTALAVFALASEAATRGEPTAAHVAWRLAVALAGGAAAGVAIGRAVMWLRERVQPAPVEIAVSLATPYLAAIAARNLGLSLAVTVMAAALTVSALRTDARTGQTGTSAEARISAMAFWEEISLLLSALMFFLAGWALPQATRALKDWALWQVAAGAAAVLGAVLAVQLAASLASTALPSLREALRRIPREDGSAGAGRWAVAGVMTWACTRSVVGLIVALSIPATLPGGQAFAWRDLILVVASLSIVGSVLLQGLTLPWAVRRAALGGENEAEREKRLAEQAMTRAHERQAERQAALRAGQAGQAGKHADDGTRSGGATDPSESASADADLQGDASAGAGAGAAGSADPTDEADPERRFEAERRVLLALRRRDRIGDEVLREMLRETDLRARAAEHDGLPGAGPPNP